MALKALAVVGDTSATAGGPAGPDGSAGAWTPRTVSESSYTQMTNHGPKVIFEAECTFDYLGTKTNTNDTVGDSTVTLTASSSVLRVDGGDVLLDGDTAQDSWGNTLTVSASAPAQVKV
ncbi:hypothetical protein L0664_15815 [Octadecabacter sp. G9-8]|uniref:Uncharacterized protein n=1 Tax=Octadecabacter dasysiphoniae TaxID=2909341 RepID=A0ABS9CZ80_9RHOB|nr:hypothetical protein [Octadecabacter dasysiphoniae]MCF2872543.1 hypothetical protein [Octadecabacter dasysiphoniae]